MLTICANLFSDLNRRGIQYFHWKSNEHIADGLNGKTDLDIFVGKKFKKEFEDVIKNNHCIKMKPQLECRYQDVDEWLGFDFSTGALIHLHVHYKMITGTKYVKEYVIPWENIAVKTRIHDQTGCVYITEPNLELIILYTRIVLKVTGRIKEQGFHLDKDYKREIKWLRNQIRPEYLKELVLKLFSCYQKEILNFLLKENKTTKDYIKFQNNIYFNFKKYKRVSHSNLRHYMFEKYIFIRNKIKTIYEVYPFSVKKTLMKKGVSVALIGSDGSGKSSLSDDIVKWLSWKLDCQKAYFGMGDGLKKSLLYQAYQCNCLPEKIREICGIIFYFWLSVRCKKLFTVTERYRKQGGITICDRFPQTQFYGINDGPKIKTLFCNNSVTKQISNCEIKNIEFVVNKGVDLTIKLIVPAEVALKRSPQHSAKEVKRKVNIIKNLQISKGLVKEVDAECEYQKVLLEVKRVIWELMRQQMSG